MKLRSSRVLRRVTPRVDPQYHIGVPDPHDLDRNCYSLSGLQTTPGNRFYNMIESRVLKRVLHGTDGY